MTAEVSPRISSNRTRLETVIPLSTPYLVFIDPSDICNAKCSWCPTGHRDMVKKYRTPQLMNWDMFKKAIDSLALMPEPIKTLRMYSDGEPLLNPSFPDMVMYAKNTRRFGQIDTTTNGSLLNEFMMCANLVASGLDKIFISVPHKYNAAYIKGVERLYNFSRGRMEILTKIIGDGLSERKQVQFYADFKNISDKIYIEHLAPCWPRFSVDGANEQVGIYGQELKEVKVCPYLFYSLKINSDGTVSACFLDWNHSMLVGDVKDGDVSEIWDNGLMKAYRDMHLNGRRYFHPMCGDCGQMKYGMPDDIDQYAEEILGRMR